MLDGSDLWQRERCADCGISNLREGEARFARFAVEPRVIVLKMRRTRAIDMAQLMQHGPLLGKNQQQRECKREANPIHRNYKVKPVSPSRLPQHAPSIKLVPEL
jgi:hypothetical protein